MEYESAETNAMILPLPVATPAREDSVKFVGLSGYEKFFHDLELGFPKKHSGYVDSAVAPTRAMSNLAVVRVGNFIASFVPTIQDFARLDPQFAIPTSTWQKIPAYADYGFAVFQLNELAGKPHPMAFEFETRLDKTFFSDGTHPRWQSA